MDGLRLWILLLGLALVASIYAYGLWQERRARRADADVLFSDNTRGGDDVGSDEEEWNVRPMRAERRPIRAEELDELSTPARESAPAVQHVKELILTLGVTATRGRRFEGAALAEAFAKAGLSYGEMNIFHAPSDLENAESAPLFSVANMVEPGTLEPEKLKHLSTPGVFLFARLPGPVDGAETWDHMQATARFLARTLDGEVCDAQRRPLTVELIEETRARIASQIGAAVERPEF